MTDDSSQVRARELFEAACDLPVADQEQFVVRSAAGDSRLAEEVLSLLRFDAQTETGDGLSDAAVHIGGSQEVSHPDSIGPYTIRGKIGEGGCGIVFRASQTEPLRREVALKLIKPGMDSTSVIRRFELEREALQRMDHPHIARVLDSGVVSGAGGVSQRPFFVMELVDGQSITAYCRNEQLGVRARIELIIQVCAAVQHAHSKGIIHRDLKPGNILVTMIDGKPNCKVIDFGVAKALGDDAVDHTMMTSPGMMVGTPEYMSPEQMRGSVDIDTRSDVYAIGVILYELLSGTLPFERESWRGLGLPELLRQIESREPQEPSSRLTRRREATASEAPTGGSSAPAMIRRLPRELDWITLRAMSHDAGRRYATVAALGDDLARFLDGEPVEAGPPTIQYKLSKFINRNRPAALAASVAIVALIAGTVVSTGFAMRTNAALDQEKQQRRLAERNENRIQDINDFLLKDLFQSVSSDDLGQDATLVELLDRAAPTIDERFADDVHMRARVHYLMGEMYGSVYRFEPSLHHLHRAESLLPELQEWSAHDKAQLFSILGRTYLDEGVLESARSYLEQSRELLMSMDDPPRGLRNVVTAQLATVYGATENYELAHAMFKEITDAAQTESEVDYPWLSKLITNRLALLASQGEHEDVIELADWLLVNFKDQDARALGYPSIPARIHRINSLGRVGRGDEALRSVDDLLAETEQFFGKRSPAYAAMLQTSGSVSYRIGRYQEAVNFGLEALGIYIEIYGPHNYEIERRSNDLALYYEDWGKQDEFVHWRTRGLLLRIYVAGPGEDESLVGVTRVGSELLGSLEAWEDAVLKEFEKVPEGHNKRARFLANAAIALGCHEVTETDQPPRQDFESWFVQAHRATEVAERPDEIRRILTKALPGYLERTGRDSEADHWRSTLITEDRADQSE